MRCAPSFLEGRGLPRPVFVGARYIVPAARRGCISKQRTRRRLTRQPDIRPYRGKHPQIAASAYIDPAAVIIGDVVIGEDSSVWPCSVVRGVVPYILIRPPPTIPAPSIPPLTPH